MVDLLENLHAADPQALDTSEEHSHREALSILTDSTDLIPSLSPSSTSPSDTSRLLTTVDWYENLRKALILEVSPPPDAAWKKFLSTLLEKFPDEVDRIWEQSLGEICKEVAVHVAPDQPPQHEKLNHCPTYYLGFKFGPRARGPPITSSLLL